MPQQDLLFSQFVDLVESFDQLSHVELQGEGEPLLHPRFFDMVRFLHTKHPGVRVSIITNGSLFSKRNISQILESGIHRILVSLESANEQEFQAIRGGKLSKVIQGLEDLMAARKAHPPPTPVVGLAITVLKHTLRQIKPIARLYQRLVLDGGLSVQTLQTMVAYRKHYNKTMRRQMLGVEERQRFQGIIATDRTVRHSLLADSTAVGFYEQMHQSVTAGSPTCPWLASGLYINTDGIATSCCFVKDAEQYGWGKATRGNLPHIRSMQQKLLVELRSGSHPLRCEGCVIAGNISHAVHHTPLRPRQERLKENTLE
jgi:MoaA/NifB/PqqE/SkfB family radical SAM enzyme